MTIEQLHELVALLQNAGLSANNATIENAIRFALAQGYAITPPAAA